jgi:hypothetical protein
MAERLRDVCNMARETGVDVGEYAHAANYT